MPDRSAPPSDDPDVARSVTAALAIALLLPFAGALALYLRGVSSSPRVSGAAIFMVLTTALLAGFVALTRRRLPRAGVLAAIHALAWSPVIGVFAWNVLSDAIVSGPSEGTPCATGLMAFLFLAAPVGAISLFLGGTALGLGFARRSTDRAIRVGAFLGVALALVAFTFALSRLGRPDADTYLASLATVGDVAPGADLVVAGRTLHVEKVTVIQPATRDDDDSMNPSTTPESHDECYLTGLVEMHMLYTLYGACPGAARVRMDPRGDLAVVEWELDAIGSRTPSRLAYRPATGAATAILPTTISDRIRAPLGWVLGAGAGGAIGLALYLFGVRVRRRALAMAGVEAEHLGLGAVRLPDGMSVTVDAAASLAPGAVVLSEPTERAPTYRATGAPTFSAALPGRLVDLRTARTDLAVSLQAMGLAVATLGATPLVIARLVGAL